MKDYKSGELQLKEYLSHAFEDSKKNLEFALSSKSSQDLIAIAEKVVESVENNKIMMFFGNGGSAAEAMHIAAEFTGKCLLDHEPWPAISLSDSQSSVTAIGNDYGFEEIFARQIKAFSKNASMVFGLTTSGNSKNVVAGLLAAKQLGLMTILFTGNLSLVKSPSYLKEIDFVLAAPSTITPRIQEIHLLWGHLIAELAEVKLSKSS